MSGFSGIKASQRTQQPPIQGGGGIGPPQKAVAKRPNLRVRIESEPITSFPPNHHEKDDKALARLVTSLRGLTKARFHSTDLNRLEELLHTGAGSDMVLHSGSASGTEPPLRLHSEILQLAGSHLLLLHKTFGHLPWSPDVVHLLVKFLYTASVVVPLPLLTEAFTACRSTHIRPFLHLLRRYPYYGLRLTSACKARHLKEFAARRNDLKLQALASDYLKKMGGCHVTPARMVVSVPAWWLRSLPSTTLQSLSDDAMVVVYSHIRPSVEHETSANIILRPEPDHHHQHHHHYHLNGAAALPAGLKDTPDDTPLWLYLTCRRDKAGAVLENLVSAFNAVPCEKKLEEVETPEVKKTKEEIWQLKELLSCGKVQLLSSGSVNLIQDKISHLMTVANNNPAQPQPHVMLCVDSPCAATLNFLLDDLGKLTIDCKDHVVVAPCGTTLADAQKALTTFITHSVAASEPTADAEVTTTSSSDDDSDTMSSTTTSSSSSLHTSSYGGHPSSRRVASKAFRELTITGLSQAI